MIHRFNTPTLRELGRRARRLRLLVTDVDGVLTDGGLYYEERGDSFKRFCTRDGVGVQRLRDAGIDVAFLSEERSNLVVSRAEDLGVQHAHVGVDDKASELLSLARTTGCSLEETAYIGDDLDDVEVMQLLAPHGLVAAPADAVAAVHRLAHYRCGAPGGYGALRDFADWLLRHRRLAVAGPSRRWEVGDAVDAE